MMETRQSKAVRVVVCALLTGYATKPGYGAQIPAEWTSGSGNYTDVSRWNINEVPLNNATDTFNVTIPNNSFQTITYQNTDGEVDEILLDNNVTLSLIGTSFVVDTDLTVLGQARIGGAINLNNADFTATGAGTQFLGNRVRLSAVNGATATIAAPSYSSSGLTGTATLFSAKDSGSKLDLSVLTSIDASFNDLNIFTSIAHTISATLNGVVDLSGVESIVAPSGAGDRVDITVQTGGEVDLSSLQSVIGPATGTGRTNLNVSVGVLKLGPLERADRVFANVDNGGVVTAGGFGGTGLITSSTISVTSGGQFNAATLVADYSSTAFTGNATLFSAKDSGSKLDLSGLTSIDASFNDLNIFTSIAHTISAKLNGVVDLSGIKSIVAPSGAGDRVDITVQTGGEVDLSSLRSIIGPATNTGRTNLNVSAGTLKLGPLERADRVFANVSNGGVVIAGGFGGTALITSSTIGVTSGGQFNAATLVADYSSTAFAGNTTLFSAANVGSILDLSGLKSINAGFVNANIFTSIAHTISATSKGMVDLSGLVSVVAPTGAEDRLDFIVNTGGEIDLSSLQTMTNAGAGRVRFNVDNGQITVGAVDPATRVDIVLSQNGSTFKVLHDVVLDSPSTLVMTEATLQVGGDLEFSLTDENSFRAGNSTVRFNGSGIQNLEVGGLDSGANGVFANDNFGFGRLVVGQDGQSTIVQLLDAIDNGNRNSDEALYLFGLDGDVDGLGILGGSALVIGDLNVYTMLSGQQTNLQDLFGMGQSVVAFDQGFIARSVTAIPEPATAWLLAMAVAPAVMGRRRGVAV